MSMPSADQLRLILRAAQSELAIIVKDDIYGTTWLRRLLYEVMPVVRDRLQDEYRGFDDVIHEVTSRERS